MDMDRVRIADVITAEYSDFLSFCSASGKIFISELMSLWSLLHHIFSIEML